MEKTNKPRTLCIGDIHGNLKALIDVMNKAEIKPDDKLIFLGDYVDGNPESAEVIQYLIDLESSMDEKPIFLKGNHDHWLHMWLITGVAPTIWKDQGGQATINSYSNAGKKGICENCHISFLNKLHDYYIDDDNNGFVHGGFASNEGLGHESYRQTYYWDRDLWNLALLFESSHKEIDDFIKSKMKNNLRFFRHKEIFIGHSSTENWNVKPHLKEYNFEYQPKNGPIIVPMNRCNVWNLDTGAGYKGRLTILDVSSKAFWQSELVEHYYK